MLEHYITLLIKTDRPETIDTIPDKIEEQTGSWVMGICASTSFQYQESDTQRFKIKKTEAAYQKHLDKLQESDF